MPKQVSIKVWEFHSGKRDYNSFLFASVWSKSVARRFTTPYFEKYIGEVTNAGQKT